MKTKDNQLAILDDDGKRVKENDEITFSYGIPPVSVLGVVQVIENELWVLTPGHNPSRCRMADLRKYVDVFYKL